MEPTHSICRESTSPRSTPAIRMQSSPAALISILRPATFGGNYSITYPDAWTAFGSVSTVSNVSNVVGSKYNDTITGNHLGNVIEGGAGDDVMSGGRGRDTFKFSGAYLDADMVNGGDDPTALDHDTLDFSGVDLSPFETAGFTTRLVVDLTAGNFGGELTYDANGAFIRFSSSATVTEVEDVIGSAFDDYIKGNTGANRLEGGEGNDLIDGAEGADTLLGGKGNDTYRVTDARAVIVENADEGTDLVKSFSTSHTLAANVENLEVNGRPKGIFTGIGNADANIITAILAAPTYGGTFTLSGGGGNDTLRGNKNADKLDGGTGDDFMAGGAGNDEYTVDSLGDQIVELDGGGSDTVATQNVNGYVLGSNLENLLVGVSTAAGSAGPSIWTGTGNDADNAIAGAAANVGFELYGMGGADQIRGANIATLSDLLDGGTGNDKLYGQAGNDILRGGLGADLHDGGAGSDTADYSLATGGVTVNLTTPALNGGEAAGDTYVSIENVTGSAHSDSIAGNAAANVLKGLDGDDNLFGLGGADTLEGGAGGDHLEGSAGADKLIGGAGNDFLVVDNTDTVVDGGEGTADVVVADKSTIATGFKFNVAGTSVETVEGNTGNDVINGTGVTYALNILGGDGRDTLTGGDGNDTLLGGNGNDTLTGGAGFDQLVGGAGDDTLNAGPVTSALGDFLLGGIGNDTLNGAGNGNLFGEEGNDKINAALNDFANGGAGNDVLIGSAGFQELEGEAGNDTLTGGAGNDFFDFLDGWGADRITDFQLGVDKLNMQNVTGLNVYADLAITDVAGGAQVAFGGNTILLSGLSAVLVTEDQFIF